MDRREIKRARRAWLDECDSATVYQALATIEPDPRLGSLFGRLAASELEHAAYWKKRLTAWGQAVPAYRCSLRAHVLIGLARWFGVSFVVPSITARELADRDRYTIHADPRTASLSREERGHAAVLHAIGAGQSLGDEGARSGSAAGAAYGNNLRAAVLGATDGLTSNFCLLVGVAGGGATATTILLTGIAGTIAGACSMALGEWLSLTNARELAQSQVDRQTVATETNTTAKSSDNEIALLYEAKGLSAEGARGAASRIVAEGPDAVDALIRSELAAEPAHAGINAGGAAIYSFTLFAAGALVPVLPFFAVRSTGVAILVSIALSIAALFALGLLTSFFNGRSPAFSGLRQVGIGAIAAAVTYAAGSVVGTAIG